jgi:trehalose 6-phosphate synthase/phosphatase
MAGAVHELSEALVVNPHNTEQVSFALKQALMMPPEEQKGANRKMQDRIRRYDINRWAEDFLERLEAAHEAQDKLYARKLTSASRKKIVYDYCYSSRRLFLLDYDGTLTRFVEKPEKAKPDPKLLSLLNRLAEIDRNEIVIISGRDRESLSRWFESMPVSLVAEHGVWIKERGEKWMPIRHLRDDWKESIRSLFEVFMDRTPGSFIEEKNYSLVWHYRTADPDLASVRVVELRETLLNLTENLNVGILEGSKVIEVKTAGINKGTAGLHWLSKAGWDFILAVGDDVTDENTFEVLPPEAYSVKVGLEMTKARYSVLDVQSVLTLLDELAGVKEA